MFEKYVLTFDRTYTMTADGLGAKIKYAPELGNNAATNMEDHVNRSVYNPNLRIVAYLDGKITGTDKLKLRKLIEYTRFAYFTSFDVDYASKEFPVVTDHCGLPIFNETEEELVLKYITGFNGFKNIKRLPFVESEWEKKKVCYLSEVESMYSRFMNAK